MPSPETIVVVGASLAGGTAAVTLRDEGYDGRLVLVGEEPELPYERPPLSKEFLRGDRQLDSFVVRTQEVWDELDVELRLGESADRIDTAARDVLLGGGARLSYDALLIATGGRPRRLAVPGAELAGIHDLRSVADSAAIRDEALGVGRAVVVGMGFIGSEVAASLRGLGSGRGRGRASGRPARARARRRGRARGRRDPSRSRRRAPPR